MRVAVLASVFALMAGTPAVAQCVYVACNGGSQATSSVQQPMYRPQPAHMAAPGASQAGTSDFDEGYAAGLAARPAAKQATNRAAHSRQAPATRNRGSASRAHTSSATKKRAVTTSTSHSAARGRAPAVTSRNATGATRQVAATSHTRTQTQRRVSDVRQASRRVTHSHTHNGHANTYQDPIKDRAGTYRPAVYGQSTTMASLMSRSGSYGSTTTTWTGPFSVVHQGGQVCGWGARIITNHQGYAQRQAVWVCQCPQGWRPPGY